MSDFDLGGLSSLLGNFKQRMEETQAQAAATEVEGVAGSGLVKVVATGDMKVQSIQIAPDAMDDRELLEDLLRAATNEALRKAQAATAKGITDLTAGLPIPPGILPGT